MLTNSSSPMLRPYRLTRLALFALTLISCSSNIIYADSMSFEFLDRCLGEQRACNPRVLARGDIELDTAALLKEFFSRHPRGPKWHGMQICFDSAGGDLEGALALGGVIHAFRLDTCMEPQYSRVHSRHDGLLSETAEVISAQPICSSACVFALAAGVHRSIAKGSRVGVHQFYGVGRDIGQRRTQMTMTELGRYLDFHGVDRRLLDIAVTSEPRWMRLLTPDEVVSLSLDNTAPIYDKWQLRVSDHGAIYARIEQRNPLTDTRTGLVLSRGNRLKLDVLFYPADSSGDESGDSFESAQSPSIDHIQLALDSAEIWLRGDEEDLMTIPKGNWIHSPQGAFLRTIELTEQAAEVLRSRQLLEVWVLVSDADSAVNPNMAFRLDTLRPLLPVLSH